MKNKFKDKKIIISILLMVVVLVFGITYAWMMLTKTSTVVNKITAGTLDLILDESSSDGILLQNQDPMSYQQGLTTQAYTFKLINNSSLNVDYTISLEDFYEGITIPTEGKLEDSKLRYIVLKDDETPEASNSKLLSSGRNIYSGVIYGNQEIEFTMYVWIDSKAGLETNGQIFSGRLNVALVQSEDQSPPVISNKNIKAAYTYNSSSCITGEESGCVETTCYENKTEGSCPAGTIVKYKVNDSEEKYFHVLHDDGDKLTLQQRENTVESKYWYNASGTKTTSGPLGVWRQINNATSTWTNVNDLTFTMGTTELGSATSKTSATGCTVSGSALSCTSNVYTWGEQNSKARMITGQEASETGCLYGTSNRQSCPVWMRNYLYNSTRTGGTVDAGSDTGYWTMSAANASTALYIANYGYISGSVPNEGYGARAVVEINK